jgi:quercetin dioxygenase-like cupin family protein
MRLLVTGKETKNAFAVVGTGGTASPPIGFHFHRETHDVFLCLKGQSGGKFSIASIERSSHHKTSVLGDFQGIAFADVHHCVQIADGYVDFTVQGSTARLSAGETLFIPAGTEFSFIFTSRLSKAYVFSNGGGLVELMAKLGTEYEPVLIPEKETDRDTSKLAA